MLRKSMTIPDTSITHHVDLIAYLTCLDDLRECPGLVTLDDARSRVGTSFPPAEPFAEEAAAAAFVKEMGLC